MNLEIHKPELVRRVNAHIQNGEFRDTDELIEKALDALEEKKVATPSSITASRRPPGRKSLAQLFADSPFKGLDIDFDRDPDCGRDVTL